VTGGMILVTITTSLLTLLMNDPSLWFFRLDMFAVGVGWAFVVITMNAGAFSQISPRDTGRAAALYNAQRQLAAALGVAVLATIVGLQSSGTTLSGNVTAFRVAFLAVAAFPLAGACIAVFIRDKDAASTMRTKTAEPSPAVPAA